MYGKFCTGDAYIVLQVRLARDWRVFLSMCVTRPYAECRADGDVRSLLFTYCTFMNASVHDRQSEWGALSVHAPLELHSPLCAVSLDIGRGRWVMVGVASPW